MLVSEDAANNTLRKTFSLTDGYVLEIYDELILGVPSYGSISFFKPFIAMGKNQWIMALLFQEIIWRLAQARMFLKTNQLHSLRPKRIPWTLGWAFSKTLCCLCV